MEPPDPIPNSAVKRVIADGSVGFPHVRVGHRQASKSNPQQSSLLGVLLLRLPEVGNRKVLSQGKARNNTKKTKDS